MLAIRINSDEYYFKYLFVKIVFTEQNLAFMLTRRTHDIKNSFGQNIANSGTHNREIHHIST